ncbi:AraC family transcriptional regulator [Tomitella cavernea]|uniref:AraC family transcriptional regulator n=1 Tax=Tomitella cavernea TaxID=1387982 RepID=A0ABP9CKY1_9ACTN
MTDPTGALKRREEAGMAVRMVPVGFVQRALHASARRGTDLDPALVAAGITAHELDNPDTRLTVDQVARFMLGAAEITDDELMGLGLAPVPRGTFALLSHAIIHCPDLDTTLHRLAGFLPALPSSAPVRIDFHGAGVRFWFDTSVLPVAGADAWEDASVVADFGLLLAHRFAAWLTGRRLEPSSVELPYTAPAPVDVVAYHHMFGIPITFGSRDPAITFAAADLASPVVQDEDSLRDFLRDSPGRLLSRRDYDTGLTARARRIVELGIRGTQPTASDVAAALAVSEPQLRRMLRQEGTSLGRLRESVLQEYAVAGLDAGESVDVISARLGFSEPSAFRRAFKRWTGRTPGEFR